LTGQPELAKDDQLKHSRREPQQPTTEVRVGTVVFGGNDIVVAAGPCSVEPGPAFQQSADAVKAAGAAILRGGAYKPRTSPYDFQGIGQEGLKILQEAGRRSGMPVVTEVLDPREVSLVAEHADMLQIGSRSIQNFPLLREAGASGHPVLLKRGMMTTVHEWLSAAEYILQTGNNQIVLCERGIRTFEHSTRNTLDLNSVAYIKEYSHLPVIVDPSHGTGNATLVRKLSCAAVAVGADGLLVEVHVDPNKAFSDGQQTITPDEFTRLISDITAVAAAVSRGIHS
jgi:3-deoxy-7-phosphoheptulonate synthase